MIPRVEAKPSKSCSGIKTTVSKISTVVPLALLLSTNAFLSSSAFLFEEKHYLYLRSITKSPCRHASSISGVLGFDDSENTNGNGSSNVIPESLTPLPTSNDFMTPEEVVTTCMSYLQGKGDPSQMSERAGLEICYNFSSDSCRMANGGSLESFLQYANNPVFQSMVGCARWEVVNVGPEIAGTPTRGSLQTVLVHVVPRLAQDGTQRNDRQFLWTIVRERRPPRQGHCLVHECVAVENAFAHTL